jgi:hypothetical protein
VLIRCEKFNSTFDAAHNCDMKYSLIISFLFILTMCTSNTEVYISTFNKQYENGKTIEVVREDRITHWQGIITKIDYGGYDNFYYSFNIHPSEDKWKGQMNQVPLALVLYGDDTYLKVTERIVKYDSLYGPANFKDTTLYFKNVDERYFFKLLGDQYFTNTDSLLYDESRSKGEELPVPYL